MSEMKTLEDQLNEFAGADYDRDTGEVQESKPQRKPRKPRQQAKHVDPFSSGQPIPGEERASVNLRHWNALVTTNPNYTKPFKRGGGFAGTAISPTWREMRMTEHFGPVGIGWGMNEPRFQLVPIEGNGELLVYCTVEVWYREEPDNPAKLGSVFGVGGDKVIARGRDGLRTSDEAFKSAFTDALGNAMKRLGVGGDVHLGLFDDDKYIREAREAFTEKAEPQKPATNPISRPDGGEPLSLEDFERQVPPKGAPSAEHVKTLLRKAAEMKERPVNEARAWFDSLFEEDREILTKAKAIRKTQRLQS